MLRDSEDAKLGSRVPDKNNCSKGNEGSVPKAEIVEFIVVLLGTGDAATENELVNSGAIQRILDLFFEYPFNNLLHHHVQSIITACLDSKKNAIIDHLFQDCEVLGKFLQADKDPSLSCDSNLRMKSAAGRQPPRVGYIGYITRIANKIIQLGNGNDHIRRYMQENAAWNDWQSNVLQERNTVENVHQWACGLSWSANYSFHPCLHVHILLGWASQQYTTRISDRQ